MAKTVSMDGSTTNSISQRKKQQKQALLKFENPLKKMREDPEFQIGPIKSNKKQNKELEELEKELYGY